MTAGHHEQNQPGVATSFNQHGVADERGPKELSHAPWQYIYIYAAISRMHYILDLFSSGCYVLPPIPHCPTDPANVLGQGRIPRVSPRAASGQATKVMRRPKKVRWPKNMSNYAHLFFYPLMTSHDTRCDNSLSGWGPRWFTPLVMVRISFTDLYGLEPETQKYTKEWFTPLMPASGRSWPLLQEGIAGKNGRGIVTILSSGMWRSGVQTHRACVRSWSCYRGISLPGLSVDSFQAVKCEIHKDFGILWIEYVSRARDYPKQVFNWDWKIAAHNWCEKYSEFSTNYRAGAELFRVLKKSLVAMQDVSLNWWMLEKICFSKNIKMWLHTVRRLLLLENVLALLSGQKQCRKLLNYILKVGVEALPSDRTQSFSPASPGMPRAWPWPLLDVKHDAQCWPGGGRFNGPCVSCWTVPCSGYLIFGMLLENLRRTVPVFSCWRAGKASVCRRTETANMFEH